MLIPRHLAHKLQTHFQVILSSIELGNSATAIQHVKEASGLITRYTESVEEERERKERDGGE